MIAPELAEEVAARYGTPAYVYDLQEVDARLAELRRALPPSRILYSLKANPLPDLVAALVERGCGAEVSSPGELRTALVAGCRPEDVLYTGPAKSRGEIAHALAAGVTTFSCESWNDLDEVARGARATGTQVAALLRAAGRRAAGSGLAMSGEDRQFGLSTADFERAHAGSEGVAVVGMHGYAGTQIRPIATLAAALRDSAALAERCAALAGLPLRILDLGGGFPWPFARDDSPLSLEGLRAPLAALVRELRTRHAGVETWFESGRYLCASAGSLLLRALDVRDGRSGAPLVVVDGGINVLGGLSGLGRALPARPTPRVLTGSKTHGAKGIADVCGPLCTPVDVLGRGIELGPIDRGALLAVPNVGAYGLTASLVGFLSRDPPAEVVVDRGRILSARRLVLEYRDER